MEWKHLGLYGSQGEIVTKANESNVGPGGLVFCLENETKYSAWINNTAESQKPLSGKWGHFDVEVNPDGDAKVAEELARRNISPGNATVAKNGKNNQYIVLYYA